MIGNMSTVVATVLAIMAFALTPRAAVAQSYSGNHPLTVTQSQRGGNARYCLTLTDNGSLGRPHSGPASLVGVGTGSTIFGTFQVIGELLTVTIQQSSDSGQNAGLVFVAPAGDGRVGTGVFDLVFGGKGLNSGLLLVGTKGVAEIVNKKGQLHATRAAWRLPVASRLRPVCWAIS